MSTLKPAIVLLCNIGSGSVSRMLDFCCSYLDDELVGPCNSSPASPVTPQDKETGHHPLTRSRALSTPEERAVTAQKSLPLFTNIIHGMLVSLPFPGYNAKIHGFPLDL